jgi:hypothetical protein
VTPLELYRLLYHGKDRHVVFNETNDTIRNSKNVGLLKQVCETSEIKRIAYASTDPRAAAIDGGAGFFYTRSRVLMLCNSFAVVNANVAALKTRATVVRFVPPSMEILTKIKTFATDGDIVEFLEQFHDCISDFSLRTYRTLEDLKAAGLDWKKYALQETDVPPKVFEISDLLVRYDTDIDRIRCYSGSRRDFYYWKPQASACVERRAILQDRIPTGSDRPADDHELAPQFA